MTPDPQSPITLPEGKIAPTPAIRDHHGAATHRLSCSRSPDSDCHRRCHHFQSRAGSGARERESERGSIWSFPRVGCQCVATANVGPIAIDREGWSALSWTDERDRGRSSPCALTVTRSNDSLQWTPTRRRLHSPERCAHHRRARRRVLPCRPPLSSRSVGQAEKSGSALDRAIERPRLFGDLRRSLSLLVDKSFIEKRGAGWK